MKATIKYIILTAIRDKLFMGLFIVSALLIGISKFLGLTALSEQTQMSIVYTAGATRFLVIFGLILFISVHIRRFFETKEIEVILTHPISRTKFIISYSIATVFITLIIAIPIIIVSAMIVGILNTDGFLLWSISLILEGVIVSAMALFGSMILKSSVSSVIFSTCFYTLARMTAFIMATANSPMVASNELIKYVAKPIFIAISWIMPRLDQFSQTSWLVYGVDNNLFGIILSQTIIYTALLLCASIIDFKSKEF